MTKEILNNCSINKYKIILLLLCCSIFQVSTAQKKSQSDTNVLHKVKYANGRLSAYSWMLKSTGNGKATCWDPQGKIMFDSEISRNHGHHSVHFQQHPNKVVSKIEESSAPDAGIQWYKSTYYYDEKGIKTGEYHQSHEGLTHLNPEQEYVVPVQKTTKCAEVYSNETWFINQTEFTLIASYTARNETKTDTLLSGDTVKIGNMIQAQFFEDPSKTAIFKAVPLKNNKRSSKWEFTFQKSGEAKNGDTCMRYYFVIGQKLLPKKKKK